MTVGYTLYRLQELSLCSKVIQLPPKYLLLTCWRNRQVLKSASLISQKSFQNTSGRPRKNLTKIFEEADKSGDILFFDEADALFGKRSDIKDSHDRYANTELAKFTKLAENRNGLTIVSVKGKPNIDEGFKRRLRTILFSKR